MELRALEIRVPPNLPAHTAAEHNCRVASLRDELARIETDTANRLTDLPTVTPADLRARNQSIADRTFAAHQMQTTIASDRAGVIRDILSAEKPAREDIEARLKKETAKMEKLLVQMHGRVEDWPDYRKAPESFKRQFRYQIDRTPSVAALLAEAKDLDATVLYLRAELREHAALVATAEAELNAAARQLLGLRKAEQMLDLPQHPNVAKPLFATPPAA